MPPIPLPTLAVAIAVTALASLIQATTGLGFAVISVPLLSLLDPRLAPVPQLLVVAPLTLSMVWRERHALDLRGVGWVLLGRIPGAGLGVLLLQLGSQRTLDVLIAACVVVAVVIVGGGLQVGRTPLSECVAGVLSGVFGLVASMGGPPLGLLYRDAAGPALRSSLAAIFSVGLLITLAARLLAREITLLDGWIALWLLPGLALGLWGSRFLLGRVEGRPLKVAILVIALLAAVGLLARAVLGARD